MPTNQSVFGGEALGDEFTFRIDQPGSVSADFGAGEDIVRVVDGSNTISQVRLTFTSSQVGNGNPNDSNSMLNQDGGLAVRIQAEDGSDGLTGPQSRFDDEGINFIASGNFTFDVRDLVSGAQRGNQFSIVRLGTMADDFYDEGTSTLNTYINAGMGNDNLTGGTGDDFLVGGAGDDILDGNAGNDSFIGGTGNDRIMGNAGDDLAIFNISTDGMDMTSLGAGDDTMNIAAAADTTQVRLTFTSSEVGNGTGVDSNTMANQDGGLAVRIQREDGMDGLVGDESRADDEGTSFVATSAFTFDVRDLVTGAQRGDQFGIVRLGTMADDTISDLTSDRNVYVNAGMGNDRVTGGSGDDFLVGGAGNDILRGGRGDDSFIGGAGNDRVVGDAGNDTAIFDVSTGGADRIELGEGDDTVAVSASAGATQVRLTFTSAEVGNGNPNDAGTMSGQDGALAVRLQAENGPDALVGNISRVDDEGTSFVAAAGVTFDVRDLVSGAQRGDQFEVVRLGTMAADTFDETGSARAYYINAGMSDDSVVSGSGNDFLVGGAGDDFLDGNEGNDSFIGGAGNDRITGNEGEDLAIFNVSTDGTDQIALGSGDDRVNIAAAAGTTQVRLTFTSAEVGNNNGRDSGALANQDGGLAVRIQREDGSDGLVGGESRSDDEGMSFISTTAGLTFDVRDLVSGAQRGNQFDVVRLGTLEADIFEEEGSTLDYYINGGMGDDRITGGLGDDFLVGGAGNDILRGREGDDSFIGGGGSDVITGNSGDDLVIFNASTDGADTVGLGVGDDRVNVTAAAGTSQVRLTFTSAEVGNGDGVDSDTMANQDGGLAVRLQVEGADGTPTGPVSRFDDEGITFTSTLAGLKFQVNDLVSGVTRGDQFDVVVLGTSRGEVLNPGELVSTSYYINAGAGNDTVIGAGASDFLVGGLGNDRLEGLAGNDSLLGGMGSDVFVFTGTPGNDTILDFVSGTDKIDLTDFANVDFGDLTFTDTGPNTVIGVDTDNDMTANFQITLVNADMPMMGDFLFGPGAPPPNNTMTPASNDFLV
jgi:Ca2+-binding RTX toxin-like protein